MSCYFLLNFVSQLVVEHWVVCKVFDSCYFLLNFVYHHHFDSNSSVEITDLLFSFEFCHMGGPTKTCSSHSHQVLLFSFEFCKQPLYRIKDREGWWNLLFSFEFCAGQCSLSTVFAGKTILLFSFEFCLALFYTILPLLLPTTLAIFFWILYAYKPSDVLERLRTASLLFSFEFCLSLNFKSQAATILYLAIFFWILCNLNIPGQHSLVNASNLAIFFWILYV